VIIITVIDLPPMQHSFYAIAISWLPALA